MQPSQVQACPGPAKIRSSQARSSPAQVQLSSGPAQPTSSQAHVQSSPVQPRSSQDQVQPCPGPVSSSERRSPSSFSLRSIVSHVLYAYSNNSGDFLFLRHHRKIANLKNLHATYPKLTRNFPDHLAKSLSTIQALNSDLSNC